MPKDTMLRRRRLLWWWVFFAGLGLVFTVATGWQLATLVFGTSGTGRVVSCAGHGEERSCRVAWTAGDRSGIERMKSVGEPGSTLPVRVLGDDVVDASIGQWVFTIAMMSFFAMVAALTIGVPGGLLMLRRRARSRVRRRLSESGDQVLWVGDTEIRNRDGTLFALLHSTHPGPDFPPSSCRIAVTSPSGEIYYMVEYRRPETVVYGVDGRRLATVRRRLIQPTHAEVFGPDEGASALATISPADRLGPMERAVEGPDGERLGTVLAGPDDALEGTLVGIRPGVSEELRAGLLGFGITRKRFYPPPRLERADDRWLTKQVHVSMGKPPHHSL